MLNQGDRLKDRYEIQGILGAVSSSRVYLAYDKDQKRNLAVKEIRKVPGDGEEIHTKITRRETELILRLNYPYFPRIEEVLEHVRKR